MHSQIVLPDLTGEYSVGVTQIPLMDSSRQENLTEDNPNDFREVMLQIWYPTDPGTVGDTMPYMDYITDSVYISMGFTENIFKNVQTHSLIDVPFSSEKPFPVIIFSPGFGFSYSQYWAFIEDIVSNGYIVVGVNHPFISGVTSFPDGHYMEVLMEYLDQGIHCNLFDLVLKDIEFVIDELHGINSNPEHLLSEKMDLANLGMYGHSFGGLAAIEIAYTKDLLKAAIIFDGCCCGSFWGREQIIPSYFMVNRERDGYSQFRNIRNRLSETSYYTVFNKTEHLDFSDMVFIQEEFCEVFPRYCRFGTINQDTLINIVNESVIAFFNSYLKGISTDSIFNVANEYNDWITIIVTGIEETAFAGISIYPNPANDLLIVETTKPGQYSIEINSLNGRLLYRDKIEGPTHQIDLSSFEKGLYFITIRSRDYVRTEKIIKL